MTKRASVFESDDDELDISGFAPKPPAADAMPAEQVRAVAEASKFPSREARQAKPSAPAPKLAPAKRQPHRRRTGRTEQINARASAETIERFYAIATQQNWLVGETLERAVTALERELAARS